MLEGDRWKWTQVSPRIKNSHYKRLWLKILWIMDQGLCNMKGKLTWQIEFYKWPNMQKGITWTDHYNTSYSRLKFELNFQFQQIKSIWIMVYRWWGHKVYDTSDPMQKESRETEYYNTGHSRFKFELNLNLNRSRNIWIFVCTCYKQKVHGTSDPTQKRITRFGSTV